MELGKDMESSEIEQRIAEQKPEQCAIITYTVSKLVYCCIEGFSNEIVAWRASLNKRTH